MTFWIYASLLTVLALLSIGLPLLKKKQGSVDGSAYDKSVYREQLIEIDRDIERGQIEAGEADLAKAEIARRLIALDEVGSSVKGTSGSAVLVAVTAVAALILVPVASIATYMQLGSPERPDMPLEARMAADPKTQSIEELIARAEARVAKKPNDARGWAVLAPVYMRLGRPADAASAYRNIIRISGSESQYESALGEALTIAANGMITVEAREHFEIAFKADPEDIKAQFFLAASLGQEGKHAESIAAWEKLIAKSPKDAPWVKPAQQEMARMHKMAGTTPKVKTPPEAGDTPPKVGGPSSEDIANAASMTAEDRKTMIENMVTGLAEKLKEDPKNIAGWLRIIRSYAVLGRNEEASAALFAANKTFADNPAAAQKLKELAEAMKIEVKSP